MSVVSTASTMLTSGFMAIAPFVTGYGDASGGVQLRSDDGAGFHRHFGPNTSFARHVPWSKPTYVASSTEYKVDIHRTPSEIDLTLARLRQFQTWGPNWNAEGASTPNLAAIDVATDLLSLIANYSSKARIRAAMCPEGLPVFFVTRESDSGEISVNEDGTIDFYFDRHDGSIVASDYDLDFNRSKLPQSLISILTV
jgi:hypothetical protein